MLDIGLFRAGRHGGNPDLVRESQRKRFAKVEIVDQVIEADEQWRKRTNAI
jgi:seryl-tRNA synthetase